MAAFPLFTALNAAIFPAPVPGIPIEGILFVQLYVVFATDPLNVTAVVGKPLHTTWFAGAIILGVGLTKIVNVVLLPGQVTPFAVKFGVTVINAFTDSVLWLIA